MLSDSHMAAILAGHGSYNYLCVTDGMHPFWSHTRVGRILHVVSPAEHEVQSHRGLR